ncbi:MAG: DUF222 domain-containing protein, partial [Nocardioidaceae bacterium]
MTSIVEMDLELRDLAAGEVLSAAAAARRAADREEARILALVVHWVDLHPVTQEHPALTFTARHGVAGVTFGETVACLDGAGTLGISEFAVESLAPALGLAYGAALALVSEAVELCFRLPRLWALVQDGRLQGWKARRVAAETMALSVEAAGFVDRHLAVTAGKNTTPSPGKLNELVHEAMLRCDPDQAAGIEQAALDARGVWFDHRRPSTPLASRPGPVAGSRGWAPPPWGCCGTGSAGSRRSRSARSSTQPGPTPSISMIHRTGCGRPSSSETTTTCSPAAASMLAAATSTTPRPTSHPTKAAHRARPDQPTSPPSADGTTDSRPSPRGDTNASPTATTPGPTRADTPTG